MNRTNVSNVLVIGSGAAGLRAASAVHGAGSEVVEYGCPFADGEVDIAGRLLE